MPLYPTLAWTGMDSGAERGAGDAGEGGAAASRAHQNGQGHALGAGWYPCWCIRSSEPCWCKSGHAHVTPCSFPAHIPRYMHPLMRTCTLMPYSQVSGMLKGYTTTAAKITAQLLSSVTKFAVQVGAGLGEDGVADG